MFPGKSLESAITAFAKAAVIPYYRGKLRRFEAMLQRGHDVQQKSLFDKIRRGTDTQFGRDHKFDQIRTVEDYRRQVPINEYEYIFPYIKSVTEGRVNALFPPSEEILAFACTTGTTGQPKLNPVTRRWLREYRRSWEVWGVKAIVEHSEMIGTKLLQLSGPGELGRSPSGLPIGMVSSIAVRFQNRVLRSFYATPFEVADISDSVAKYYTILRLSMISPVGFIVAITPANLRRLAEVGHDHRESLIRDIYNGTLREDLDLAPSLRQLVSKKIGVKRPARARELEKIIERTGTLYPKDYWPLSLVSCWLGGTIGYQSRNLSRYYGSTPARDLGLVSTEGRHTIPLHDNTPQGVLAVDGSYYEFIDSDARGTANPRVLEGRELKPGGEYYLLMTTSSGLYRYDIGDVVRCEGFVGQAPVLEFLHKASHYADMEGEKLSGHQVTQAVEVAGREMEVRVNCFTAVPVRRDGEVPYYALLVEADAIEDDSVAKRFLQAVDRELIRQNVMYAGKRNDLYIDYPRLVRLPLGSWSAFTAEEADRRGTGDSQFKHPPLVPETTWIDRFQPISTVAVEKQDALSPG